jgi:hypothetical protein
MQQQGKISLYRSSKYICIYSHFEYPEKCIKKAFSSKVLDKKSPLLLIIVCLCVIVIVPVMVTVVNCTMVAGRGYVLPWFCGVGRFIRLSL